jgi:SnoaL-like domain
MERADVARWLKRYVEAWRSYDRDAIADLFAEHARYRYHPYDEWIEGRAAVVGSWLEDPDEENTWDAAYEPYAVDGDVAVAIGSSTYTNPDGSINKVFENCFLMRFDADGRCSEFTEFFMERATQ